MWISVDAASFVVPEEVDPIPEPEDGIFMRDFNFVVSNTRSGSLMAGAHSFLTRNANVEQNRCHAKAMSLRTSVLGLVHCLTYQWFVLAVLCAFWLVGPIYFRHIFMHGFNPSSNRKGQKDSLHIIPAAAVCKCACERARACVCVRAWPGQLNYMYVKKVLLVGRLFDIRSRRIEYSLSALIPCLSWGFELVCAL